VIESDAERVADLRERGIPFVEGNAASKEVLGQANPGLVIVARAHSDPEIKHLRELGANTVIMGERQIALEMTAEIERLGPAAIS
jgi:CPA2 family monovalent cation:H+ antiporter-2